MLPQASARSWASNYDAFRSVPKELAEASWTGAMMTVIAVVTCIVLFLCEAMAFMQAKTLTRIVVDSNPDAVLRINFDIHMLDLACDHLTLGVWDAFGTERVNVTRNVQKQRIDHKGQRKGQPYTEEELAELEFSGQTFTKEELAELDSDWGSSSDSFKHDSLRAVVDAHDFTFVNFYADWCPHCQMFAPTWLQLDESINKNSDLIKDADNAQANVRVLKLNCVDFEATCREQNIGSFPSLRLYRRGAKEEGKMIASVDYHGQRTIELMTAFLVEEAKKHHLHTGATYHNLFAEGCRISGHLDVPRVPGTLHFQAAHSDKKALNLAFTNVSHTVHHFSFGEAPRGAKAALPPEYRSHVSPLDGRTFLVDKFHKAPNHFIKVVHTRFETGSMFRSYQQTHQWTVRVLQRSAVPQAKFSYDLSPVEVIVSKGDRRWYDFVTQVFAIIGGAFTFMSMATGVLNLTSAQIKNAINKNV